MADELTLISVRGDAHREVAPDWGRVHLTVRVRDADRAQAMRGAALAQQQLLSALRELGGVALTPGTVDAPLTWSAHALGAHEDYDHRGEPRLIGWVAQVSITVAMRDFALGERLYERLSEAGSTAIQQVVWGVDAANPVWRDVRADAIQEAIAKARDYAAALNGTLVRLEHVADAGLLGADRGRGPERARAYAMAAGGYGEEAGISLDPVPQTVSAVIEARVSARVDAL